MRSLRQPISRIAFGALVAAVAAVAWLQWARDEYPAGAGCPWDLHRGHPLLIGLAVTAAGAGVAGLFEARHKNTRTIVMMVAVEVIVIAAITAAVAFFFGAARQCLD